MATYNAVQFNGADKVIQAYTARGIKAWGLFCDKDFLGCYEGSSADEGVNELNNWLEMLGESVGVYTLKVYDKLPPDGITDKTAAKGSFKFRLRESGSSMSTGSRGDNSAFMELYREAKKENADLKHRMAMLEAELEESEDTEDTSAIGGFLKNITARPEFMQWAMGLFAPAPQPQYYAPPVTSVHPGAGALGNMPTMPAATEPSSVFESNEIPESELVRLGQVYALLRPKMPDALSMLERLVEISVQDTQRFEGIKSTIKMFL